MRGKLVTLFVVLFAPLMVWAQPLADRVPADAVVYVGWSGTADMGPGYQASHLKAVLDASNLREFVNEFLPAVVKRVGQEEPNAAAPMNALSDLGKAAWKYPTAFFTAGLDVRQGQPPTPKAGLMMRAGPDAAAVLTSLENLLREARGQSPFPIVTFNNEGLVGVLVGYTEMDLRKTAGANSLAAAPAFKSAVAQVQKSSVFAAYVDGEGILKLANQMVQLSGDPQAAKQWPVIRDKLGLAGLKQVMFTAGFQGAAWEFQGYVGAPAPRTGLLAMLDSKPVSDRTLKLVPRWSRMATAGSLDLQRLLAAIEKIAHDIDVNAGRQVDAALAEANKELGFDLEKDLLGSLGPEWATYYAPTVGGNGLLGSVIANPLRDPAKTERALTTLTEWANRKIGEALAGEKLTIAFRQTQAGGLKITYLATPLISPAWTIKDGVLYAALFPQIVISATRVPPTQTILDNPDFIALRKQIAGPNGPAVSSIEFTDLPRAIPDNYGSWLFISRMAGFGDIFGVPSPVLIVPPLDALLAHATPAAGFGWTADDGFHYRSTTPFPGAGLLATDPLGAYFSSSGPVAVGILLPSLNRAREQANRIQSANNLRQMGLGMQLYATDNQGKFPADFAELYRTQDLPATIFVNPRGSSSRPPPDADRAKEAAAIEQIGDYVYVGKGLTTIATPDTWVAYENPNGLQDGINVLFADIHIEFIPMDQAMEKIEKLNEKK